MGTEWGLGTFTIEQTTEDGDSDPPLGREQAPRATATSPPAAGLGTERRSVGRPAPRSVTRAERAIRTAPKGTSWGGAPGVNGSQGARSNGERDGTRSAGRTRGGPRESPAPDGPR
jgi:hypothetical protein